MPFFGKVVILVAYCDFLYMLHIAKYVCTHVGRLLQIENLTNKKNRKVSTDIVGLNVLLVDLNYSKQSGSFQQPLYC